MERSEYNPLAPSMTFEEFARLYLDMVCPVPRSVVAHADYARLHHLDLPDMSDDALAREARRTLYRADIEPDPADRAWLEGRLNTIHAEQHDRGRGRHR